ncbi:MAG: DUF4384 domain-containing protein [Alphaproteobacteria bacterium]|nr:DUF4384 domain-containing protein [Alphaproteobacteria bacterium]
MSRRLLIALALAASPALAQGSKGLTRASQSAAPLGVRALSIGVGDFPNLEDRDDLTTAEADAALVAEALGAVVPAGGMTVLTGPQARAERVRQELSALLDGTREDEAAVIYWATHGAAVGRRGYLLAQDSVPEGRLPYTAIALTWLGEQLAKSRAGQVLLFLDAVHQELEGPKGLLTGPASPINPLLGALADAREGVFVMTSSRPRESISGGGGACSGHGPFACALAQALQGAADLDQDGRVELGELAQGMPRTVEAVADVPLTPTSTGRYVSDLAFPAVVPATTTVARATRPEALEVCFESNGRDVPADHIFATGDTLALSLTVPADGHLYIIATDDSGALVPAFPLPGESSRVSRGATVRLPPPEQQDPLVFVPPAEPEELYLLWSAEPIAEGAQVASAWRAAVEGSQVATNTSYGAKGLMRPSQQVDQGPRRCSEYTPKGDDGLWVIDLVLNHVDGRVR